MTVLPRAHPFALLVVALPLTAVLSAGCQTLGNPAPVFARAVPESPEPCACPPAPGAAGVPPPPASTPAAPPPADVPAASPLALGSDPFLGPGGGGASAFNGVVGQLPLFATYRGTWFPDQPVSGQPTKLGFLQENLAISVPCYQDCRNEVSFTTNVRGEFFNTGAVLPDTHQPFPDELWNIRFGANYRHLFDNGWIAGVNASVGSASDKPFNSINELTESVAAFLRVPSGDRNAWLFTLAYSPNSELPVPVPGVAYVWQPADNFRANIGLPFQLWYRPLDDLTLDFSYMLLRTVHARATYRISNGLRAHVGFDWSNESYFLADRSDTRERFFYYDKRVTAGVQYIFNKHASLDLFGGYTFDRFYFEGVSYSDNNQNRVNVGDGPFLGLRFQARW